MGFGEAVVRWSRGGVLVGVVAIAGCSDDGEAGDGGATFCHETSSSTEIELPYWDCALPTPCDPAVLHEGYSAIDDGLPARFVDAEAARCTARALRDRTAAVVTISYDYGPVESQFHTTERIFILGGDRAGSEGISQQDYVADHWASHRLLRPPAYFDGCLSASDDQRFYECLAAWSTGECADGPATCF